MNNKKKFMNNFWSHKRKKKRSSSTTVIKNMHGELQTEPDKLQDCILNHFKSIDRPSNSTLNSSQNSMSSPVNNPKVNIMFDKECNDRGDRMARYVDSDEIDFYINASSNGKASGLDGIPNDLLKILKGEVLSTALKNLYNAILDSEHVPISWGTGETTLLKKGHGLDYTDLNNYRGITLQSCIAKLFFKILLGRVNADCENRKVYSFLQFAFRGNHGTSDALYILNEIIRQGKEGGRDYHLGFLDLKKAFDSVDRGILWNELYLNGYSGKFLRLLKSHYKNTSEKFRINNISTD